MTAETMGAPAMPAPGTPVVSITTNVVMGSSDEQAVYLLDRATGIEIALPAGCGEHLIVPASLAAVSTDYERVVVMLGMALRRIAELEEDLRVSDVLTMIAARSTPVEPSAEDTAAAYRRHQELWAQRQAAREPGSTGGASPVGPTGTGVPS